MRSSRAFSFLAIVALACSGCASAMFRNGLACQDSGDYIGAYGYFSELLERHPSNDKYRAYAENSRRLAFDQCIGLAQQSFADENLDDFVKNMKQANDIRPHRGSRMAVMVVENGREKGDSDSKIIGRLKEEMEMYGADGTLGEALEKTAGRIAESARSGLVKDPVLVAGMVFGDGNKRNSACVYLENELTAFLIDAGIRVVDRANLDAIRDEMRLGNSAMADESQAVEMGKIAGAKTIVTGTFFKWEGGYKYQLKVTDVETSKVVMQDSSVFKGGRAFDDMVE